MRKSYRVKREKDFQQVFLNGKSCANRNFVCYHLEKKENQHFRVGFSVGKKIGNAVKRNQMKRFMRQAILELKPHVRQNVDFILIARVSAKNLTMKEVYQNTRHLLQLATIYEETLKEGEGT